LQIPGPFFNILNSFEVLAMGGVQRLRRRRRDGGGDDVEGVG